MEREGGGTHPAPPKRLPVLASSLTAALALAWLVALILLATTLLLAIVLVSLPLRRTLVTLISLSALSSLVPLLSWIVLVGHLDSLKGAP